MAAAIVIQTYYRGAVGWEMAAREMRRRRRKRLADRRLALKALYYDWFLKHAYRASREHILLNKLQNMAAVKMQVREILN